MTATLSIRNNEGKFQRFTVQPEVALYIKQLEHFILRPGKSNLLVFYKDRFGHAPKMLRQIEGALDCFEGICKLCIHRTDDSCPIPCVVDVKIDTLKMIIEAANGIPNNVSANNVIKLNQEIDCKPEDSE